MKPGSTSMLARPNGPLKALKPAGQPAAGKKPLSTGETSYYTSVLYVRFFATEVKRNKHKLKMWN